MNSTWNYRILAIEILGDLSLQIHSVYYTDGVPDGYGETPAYAAGDSIGMVTADLQMMTQALSKPILWGGDKFPEVYSVSVTDI